MLNDKPLHKIHLGFGPALTRTVFVRAKRRDIAERRALRTESRSTHRQVALPTS
jgi:hypothetical protein